VLEVSVRLSPQATEKWNTETHGSTYVHAVQMQETI